jgi:CheY-like chemotaxis protein
VPIRVLLVDDAADVRRLVRTALRFRGGFDLVGEAGGGTEAVRMCADLQPEVVVLDLGLPDLAGRDVLTGIREGSPESKVVVFSGSDSSEDPWIADHVDGYLLKDVELDYLIDLLESIGRQREGQVALELPKDLHSVGRARQFVRETVADWNLSHVLDDSLIVASELAANAVTHADSSCVLRVSLHSSALRIEVLDGGIGTPEPQPPSETSERGRGLRLVAALSAAWGVEAVPGEGKVVWAELPLPL